jgi:hypothetical protein
MSLDEIRVELPHSTGSETERGVDGVALKVNVVAYPAGKYCLPLLCCVVGVRET